MPTACFRRRPPSLPEARSATQEEIGRTSRRRKARSREDDARALDGQRFAGEGAGEAGGGDETAIDGPDAISCTSPFSAVSLTGTPPPSTRPSAREFSGRW